MKISIVIITYNRADQLSKLLQDLLAQVQQLAISDLELLLVDNNSTDNTKEVTKNFSSKIKYIFEPNQGVSYARNTGVINSTGELIVFLDDDVRLHANWLQVICDLPKNVNIDKAVAYGARVIPDWGSAVKPAWINFSKPFAISQSVFPSHDFGEEDHAYPFVYNGVTIPNPIGACMIFSRKVFELLGDFRVDLGPGLAYGLIHEDTEYFRYLLDNKIEILYLANCMIYHPVSQSRTTIDYACQWYYKSGLSLYFISHFPRTALANSKALFVGVPAFLKPYLDSMLEDIKFSGTPLYLIFKILILYIFCLASRFFFWRNLTNWLLIHIAKTKGEIAAAQLIDQLRKPDNCVTLVPQNHH